MDKSGNQDIKTDIKLFEYSIPQLMEHLASRCHDGCVLISCYKDEDLPTPAEGTDNVMVVATGFANSNEVMKIMVTMISEMVDDYVDEDRKG